MSLFRYKKVEKLKLKNYWILILSAIAWLAIDLISKSYITNLDFEQIKIINDFFYITHVLNKGVAFGIKLGYALQIIISIIVILLLIYYGTKFMCTSKKYPMLNQFLLGIVVGGGVGNLINRLQLGYVVDFIVLKPLPVFNIADIGITIGLFTLFIISCKE